MALPALQNLVIAQERPLELIQVTGSHLTQDSPGTTASRLIVDSEDIAAIPTLDLVDGLRGRAGVDIFRQGGPASRSYLSLRGGEPNFTVILLDGIRLNDPTDSRGGAFDLALLDPMLIERIEVIKGSYSAVYGSDALAGAVNLITRKPGTAFETNAIAGIGSDESFDIGLSMSGALSSRANAIVSASYLDHGEQLADDRRTALNLSGVFSVRLGDEGALTLRALHSGSDTEAYPEDSGGPRLATLDPLEQRRSEATVVGADVAFRRSRYLQPRLSIYWNRITDNADHPGILPGALQGIPASSTESVFEQVEIIGQNEISPRDDILIGIGGAVRIEDGTSDGVLDVGFPLPTNFSLKRHTIGAFVEARLQWSDNSQAGLSVRLDDPETAAAKFTSRAFASYEISSAGLTIQAAWGNGFKLPSFFALGHPVVGNPDLEPETATNKEISLHKIFADTGLSISISAFHSKFKNLIDFDAALFTSVNRAKVTAKGLEVSAKTHIWRMLDVEAALTRQKVRQSNGQGLRYRPDWKGYISTRWLIRHNLDLTLKATWIGNYLDSSIPTGLVTLGGYARLDAALDWRLNRLEWQVAIANLTDSHFEEAIGFPTRGTTARFRVKTGF